MQSPWSIHSSEVLSYFSVNPERGLVENDIYQRLQKYGPNSMVVKKKKSRLALFIKQFKNPVVYVLIVAFCL